jgi:hypothetical protein
MIKIIFLDIDGVLNSETWFESQQENIDKLNQQKVISTDQSVDCQLDPQAIKQLNRLINLTDAKVVISSTWRFGDGINTRVKPGLSRKGFKGEIIGATGKESCGIRGCEIRRWLKDHDINSKENLLDCFGSDFKSFVILDDDSDMLLEQKDNFVHVDSKIGLSDKDVEQAIRILNNEC